jgi:hypothetical protein
MKPVRYWIERRIVSLTAGLVADRVGRAAIRQIKPETEVPVWARTIPIRLFYPRSWYRRDG